MAKLIIHQSDGTSRVLKSMGPIISVGRDADNTLVLSDPRVSRRHFVIECADGGYTLTNHSATHGTLLNGKSDGTGSLARGGNDHSR